MTERTPGERIGAFRVAINEELLRPVRRYLRGFRRGLLVGLVLGVLFAPWPGSAIRGRGAVLLLRRRRRSPA